MPTYFELIQQFPRPAKEQIRAFVDYAADAHSWYKHLPLTPPGFPFVFFLDPNAGCDLIIESDGRARYRERTESTPRFHYNWQVTVQYRQRFGYLEFFTAVGTSCIVGDAEGFLSTRKPGLSVLAGIQAEPVGRYSPQEALGITEGEILKIFWPGGLESLVGSEGSLNPTFSSKAWVDVPDEVIQAGCVELTAVVHSCVNSRLWRAYLANKAPGDLTWPAQTGGRTTLEKIMAMCGNPSEETDRELNRLFEPERYRQKSLMRDAIERVLEVVFS